MISLRTAALVALIGIAEAAPMMESIEFWRQHGGSAGVWWAIAMPVTALFLWFYLDNWQRWAIGGLASITLLAAPLWQVAAPALGAQANIPTRIQMLRDQIAEGTHKADTYVNNSAARAGWLPAIQANDQALTAHRQELFDLLAHPANASAWLSWAVAVIQALSLVLMHAASVIAIRYLGALPASETGGMQETAALLDYAQRRKDVTKQQDNANRNAPITLPGNDSVTTARNRQTRVNEIYQRLIAGAYGNAFSGRNVRETERISYEIVKEALSLAEDAGKILRVGQQGFELVIKGADV